MKVNPFETANSTLNTLNAIRDRRQQVNNETKLANARVESMQTQDKYTQANTDKLQFELDNLRNQMALDTMRRGLYEYNLYGNPSTLNDLMARDATFNSKVRGMGIQKFVDAKNYLSPDIERQIKEQLAIMDGKGGDEEYINSIPRERIGLIVDNGGNLQWQDVNTYGAFVPGYDSYAAQRQQETAVANLALEKSVEEVKGAKLDNNTKNLLSNVDAALVRATAQGNQRDIALLSTLKASLTGKLGEAELGLLVGANLLDKSVLGNKGSNTTINVGDANKSNAFNALASTSNEYIQQAAVEGAAGVKLPAGQSNMQVVNKALNQAGITDDIITLTKSDVGMEKLGQFVKVNGDFVNRSLNETLDDKTLNLEDKNGRAIYDILDKTSNVVSGLTPKDTGPIDGLWHTYVGKNIADFSTSAQKVDGLSIAQQFINNATLAQNRIGGSYISGKELKNLANLLTTTNRPYTANLEVINQIVTNIADKLNTAAARNPAVAVGLYDKMYKARQIQVLTKAMKDVYNSEGGKDIIDTGRILRMDMVLDKNSGQYRPIIYIRPKDSAQNVGDKKVVYDEKSLTPDSKLAYTIDASGKLVPINGGLK